MFNWYAAPTFAAMLVFAISAAYVLTRSPRAPATFAAVAAQAAIAAYLFGQAMQANAATLEEWRPWARNLQWGAAVAPTCWYWLTALLLGEQPMPAARRYLRRAGYPLGALFGLGCLAICAAVYLGDWFYVWFAPQAVPAPQAAFYHYRALAGPLYPAFTAFALATTLAAGFNLWFGARLPVDPERRRRFHWLLVGAALFFVGGLLLTTTVWLGLGYWPLWLGQAAIAAAVAVMASNVAAYGLLINVEVVRGDLLYFALTLVVSAVAYGLVFALAGPGYSFRLLELFWYILLLAIVGRVLLDSGRRLLDRLFYRREVRTLRDRLSGVVQRAPVAPDVDQIIVETRAAIAEVSAEHVLRLTEEALRRLNRPGALAQCGLIAHLPRTLASSRATAEAAARGAQGTPLEQARALREVLVAAIERLKPAERAAPAAVQYVILSEEYVRDLPNKQIMARHDLSEGTFSRQRREAIAVLARELRQQEDLLARQADGALPMRSAAASGGSAARP